MSLIQKESEKRFKNNMHTMPVSDFPKRRFEHPNARGKQDEATEEPTIESGQQALDDNRPSRNFSITMRAKQENALIEFPLESNRDNGTKK